jgi:FAD/FMN-containing dehydrogenase
VVGYSLGGGIGWLARKYGTAAQSIRAIELVTAGGEPVRADAQYSTDLFWALRGGGGSFGVVTAVEFNLYPVTRVFAGGMYWPSQRAPEILSAWSEWTQSAPDEMTSIARLLKLPRMSDIPRLARGRQMVAVEAAFAGQQVDGLRLLKPLRDLEPDIDTFAGIPTSLLGTVHMDPPDPIPSASAGVLLREFPLLAAEALTIAAGNISGAPLVSVEVRHLGGALAHPSPPDAVFSLADAGYGLYAVGRAWNAETRAAVELNARRVVAALAPWSAGRSTMNFTEQPVDPATLFPPGVYDRLRAVKATYDKDNMFCANHSIPPA